MVELRIYWDLYYTQVSWGNSCPWCDLQSLLLQLYHQNSLSKDSSVSVTIGSCLGMNFLVEPHDSPSQLDRPLHINYWSIIDNVMVCLEPIHGCLLSPHPPLPRLCPFALWNSDYSSLLLPSSLPWHLLSNSDERHDSSRSYTGSYKDIRCFPHWICSLCHVHFSITDHFCRSLLLFLLVHGLTVV